MFWRKKRIEPQQKPKQRATCDHVPDSKLTGESRVISQRGFVEDYPYSNCMTQYREIVTDQVCCVCDVRYVTRHKVDEKSASIGPEKIKVENGR